MSKLNEGNVNEIDDKLKQELEDLDSAACDVDTELYDVAIERYAIALDMKMAKGGKLSPKQAEFMDGYRRMKCFNLAACTIEEDWGAVASDLYSEEWMKLVTFLEPKLKGLQVA